MAPGLVPATLLRLISLVIFQCIVEDEMPFVAAAAAAPVPTPTRAGEEPQGKKGEKKSIYGASRRDPKSSLGRFSPAD